MSNTSDPMTHENFPNDMISENQFMTLKESVCVGVRVNDPYPSRLIKQKVNFAPHVKRCTRVDNENQPDQFKLIAALTPVPDRFLLEQVLGKQR